MRLLTASLIVGFLPFWVYCQTPPKDSTISSLNNVSDKTLERLSHSYAKLNSSVSEGWETLLRDCESREFRISALLQTKDSNAARQLAANSVSFYQGIQKSLQCAQSDPLGSLTNYLPGIDSMQTAIQFLNKAGLSADKLQKLQALGQQLKSLQGSLQNASNIQSIISER